MNFVTRGIALLTALEFFYIFYLETVITSSAKIFGMSEEELSRRSVQTLFKNQGVYNALLGVLLLLASFVFVSGTALTCLFLYIVAVAAYGSFTSSPKIIFMQGGLPMIGLVTLLLLH